MHRAPLPQCAAWPSASRRRLAAVVSLAFTGLAACGGDATLSPDPTTASPVWYDGVPGLTGPATLLNDRPVAAPGLSLLEAASTLPAGSVAIEPQRVLGVGNCFPFGDNHFGMAGFIYRDVPAFELRAGDKIAFDLGAPNDVDIRREVYFAAANRNPAAGAGFSQDVRAVEWVRVASESETPANPRGNSIIGDYELQYTAISNFSFGGGGFIIAVMRAPGSTYEDGGCNQVLAYTDSEDPSGHFYVRFYNRPLLYTGTLDGGSTGSADRTWLGGFRIIKSAPVNQAPVVAYSSSDAATIGEGASLDLTLTASDANGDALTYSATFGDGQGVTDVPITSSPFTIRHSYADDAPAPLTITVTVEDGNGGSATVTKQVTVHNVAPTLAGVTAPATVTLTGGSAVAAITLGAITDPGANDGPFTTSVTCGGTGTHADGSCTFTQPGIHTVSATATDKDGGVSTVQTVDVHVVYAWSGFFPPVRTTGINVVKPGSAIPVKFSLGGDYGLGVMASGYPVSRPVSCSAPTGGDAATATTTAGDSRLTYDATEDQYVYVWKSDRAWTGCRELIVRLADGTDHTAIFRFTK